MIDKYTKISSIVSPFLNKITNNQNCFDTDSCCGGVSKIDQIKLLYATFYILSNPKQKKLYDLFGMSFLRVMMKMKHFVENQLQRVIFNVVKIFSSVPISANNNSQVAVIYIINSNIPPRHTVSIIPNIPIKTLAKHPSGSLEKVNICRTPSPNNEIIESLDFLFTRITGRLIIPVKKVTTKKFPHPPFK